MHRSRVAVRCRAWLLGVGGALALAYSASPGMAQAAATGTTAFNSPGTYLFTVPPGVTTITVIAVGAAGGGCALTGSGGKGAVITASVPTSPGLQLVVGVGAPGNLGVCNGGNGTSAGGLGGGGAGGGVSDPKTSFLGGGGGGASLVGLASPSPSFGGPLVVAAGGGGAGDSVNGGDAGMPGQQRPLNACKGFVGCPTPGGGGGPGGLAQGGTGGTSDSATNPNDHPGAPGTFAIGGTGGSCSTTLCGGGGGGGGGYYGGGGGGAATPGANGGGGGGSSFALPGTTGAFQGLSNAQQGAVVIDYPAATADESPSTMRFAGLAPGSAGPEQVLTVTNNGSAPLVVSGVLLGGSDPGDFLVGDRCQLPIAAGASCQVGVRFSPQAAGARSATLTLLTNAAHAPAPVPLSNGGVTAVRRSREVELVTCRPIAETLRNELRGAPVKTERCTRKRVSGAVKFTATGASVRATLIRRRVVYATGASVLGADGRTQLVLTDRRPLKPGTYTLILRHRRGRHNVRRRLRVILR